MRAHTHTHTSSSQACSRGSRPKGAAATVMFCRVKYERALSAKDLEIAALNEELSIAKHVTARFFDEYQLDLVGKLDDVCCEDDSRAFTREGKSGVYNKILKKIRQKWI